MARFLEKLADEVRRKKSPAKKQRKTEPVAPKPEEGPQPAPFTVGDQLLLDPNGKWYYVERTHSNTFMALKNANPSLDVGRHWMRVRQSGELGFEFIEDPKDWYTRDAQEWGMNAPVDLAPTSAMSDGQWAAIEDAVYEIPSLWTVSIETADGVLRANTAKDFITSGETLRAYMAGSLKYAAAAPASGGRSPWGKIDYVQQMGDGIYIVGTPGHGGVWLSRERLKEMPATLKTRTQFYDGGPWFEEDCEVARVMVAFPEAFPDMSPGQGEEHLKSVHPDIYKAWMGAQEGFGQFEGDQQRGTDPGL